MENPEVKAFLYDALNPLQGEASAEQSTAPSLSPFLPDKHEAYTVFRSEVSLSSTLFPFPETAAQDYFSLDADEEVDEVNRSLFLPPHPASLAVPVKESARTFEGNWFSATCRLRSPMLQLHKEIIDFCDFLSPSQEEQAARSAAVERVFEVIKYIWPESKPEVFGSFRTGLYLPSSDIDVVIMESDIRSPQIGLHALSKALSQKRIARKIQVIAKARVPIIKFVEKKSGISFDISFDLQNGPKAAEFIVDSVSKWPPLRPLCLILKIFLQQRELNEVYTGGIGSYGLLVMLIAMLRNHRDFQASREQNLGVLLVGFFDLYGRKLNTSSVGLSCNGEGTFFQKRTKGFSIDGKANLISIEDPQAPENDVGKSSFNYFQVKSAFAMAFTTLTNANAILESGSSRSILGMIIRPDEVLLERKGGSCGAAALNCLFPGAADQPLSQQYIDQHDMHCNWHLHFDDDEELLPRGNDIADEDIRTERPSGKKRKKSLKERHTSKKKMRDNGEMGSSGSSRKENSPKRHRKRWSDEDGSSARKEKSGKKRYGRKHGGSLPVHSR